MSMERTLSLVLDTDAKISLTLEKMEAKALDEYISKNFNSSEEVRKKYASVIDEFLSKHQNFIQKVETDNNKRYAGSIVITELQDDLTVKRIKVLYKRDIRIFKEITKNSHFILGLENRDYINYVNALKNNENYKRIFLDYYAKELRFRNVSEAKFKRVMEQWRSAIKQSYRYYDIIRAVLKEYENRYQQLKLPSPNNIYSTYLASKSLMNKSKELEKEIQALDKLKSGDRFEKDLLMHIDDYKLQEEPTRFKNDADEEEYLGDLENHLRIPDFDLDDIIDLDEQTNVEQPKRYKTGADEEGYPGDLEKLNSESYLDEEDSGFTSSKTKSLHNNHYKLFTNEDN